MFGINVSVFIAVLLTGADGTYDYDIVIKAGRIVDGSGAPWYAGDLGIRDGKISKIGRLEAARAETTIDAKGLIVAPGFIDMMGQTATPMLENPQTALNLLSQGITTINAGEGVSAAPLAKEDEKSFGYTTMAEYFQLLEIKGMPVNVVQTVGHTQIRRLVLGDIERRPTTEELTRMQDLVREAMEAGAIGVSTALIYPPAVYAQTEEIAALARVAGEYGGRYYTHMRNEGDLLLEAIGEAIAIGREAQTPVHIFHLKTAGKANWGKMPLAIARIKAARAEGMEVTADIYPYINNGLGIAAFIHPRHFAEGQARLIALLDKPELRAEIQKEMETTSGWENWYRHVGSDWERVVIGQTGSARYEGLDGLSVAAIAKAKGEKPWDTFFELVRAGAFALPESMTEANKILALQQEFISFCTDVGPAGGSRSASHPRAYGAFPRLLSRYVRQLGVISLERAVAQASAVAANDVLAYDRGRLSEGLAADIVIFDEAEIEDKATFANPHELSVGMKHVIVNGELVYQNGKMTARRPGRVLRGPGYRPEQSPAAIATGSHDPLLEKYDELMRQFMKEHRVPGAALAVTDHGRLVFAKGYGYADVAAREKVTSKSLFRIASISKPITAVAILQLIEQGKLTLDSKVFEILDYEEAIGAAKEFDARQREITIRHLLEHRGGWDRDKSFDAMFQSVRFAKETGGTPPAAPDAVIRAMVNQKLDFEPGERYAYSNYGYCLLGRVIERLTGQSYEDYVKAHVLSPIGVHSMRIGRTHLADRSPGEVRYYDTGRGPSVFAADLDQLVPWPYGVWYLEAMDSHGAWIASAEDLARFACAMDDPQRSPLLKPESMAAMHTRPPGLAGHSRGGKPKSQFYSLGWQNRELGDGRVDRSHSGSLAGTATILIRRHDGRNLVVLFNARNSPTLSHLGSGIIGPLDTVTNAIEKWPMIDLFAEVAAGE